MGCWGMGMTQSDDFCDVYEQFMNAYDTGENVTEITKQILKEYHQKADGDDGILHDVFFALAKAEWMCCAQSQEVLNKVKNIIDSEANLVYLRDMGACESDIRTRSKNLNKFWTMLQTPRETPRKRKPKCEESDQEAGTLFWYRSKGVVYGALLLEEVCGNYLVALTEALESEPKSPQEVLDAPVYTVAWFLSLLPSRRMHKLATISLEGAYNGRAGGCFLPTVHSCNNMGFDSEWSHTNIKCSIQLPGKKLKELTVAENVPVIYREGSPMQMILEKLGLA